MAHSQTSVVNTALIFLGVDVITSIDDTTSEQARKANAVWDMAFYTVLEAKEWTFAKKTVELAQHASPPTNEDEWGYRYALPSDFIRMVRKSPLSFGDTIPYEIRGDSIYCNFDNTDDELYLTYIRKLTTSDIPYCASSFLLAVAFLIASFLAARFSKATRDEMMQKYLWAVDMAEGVDATKYGLVEYEEGSDEWTDAGRGGISNTYVEEAD